MMGWPSAIITLIWLAMDNLPASLTKITRNSAMPGRAAQHPAAYDVPLEIDLPVVVAAYRGRQGGEQLELNVGDAGRLEPLDKLNQSLRPDEPTFRD